MLEIIMEDDFLTCSPRTGHACNPCHIVLTESFIDVYLNKNCRNPLLTFPVADIVGCSIADTSTSKIGTSVSLKLHVCPLMTSMRGVKYRKLETVIFSYNKHSTVVENEASVLKWTKCITSVVRENSPILSVISDMVEQPHLLVFINPKSGIGTAVKTFEQTVATELGHAGITFDAIVTKCHGYAQNYVMDLPSLSHYTGIVVISGDGLLHEVYNGLFNRKDSETALSKPVGIIPQGSGNGLARSIAHFTGEPYLQDPVLTSTLNLVKLKAVACDLAVVTLSDNSKMCSFLSIGWGLLADIDIESERLRSLGEARFTVWALARLLRLRTYKARLSYLPATLTDVIEAVEKVPLPTLKEPITEDWIVLEGNFVCIYSGLQPYLGTDLFFAPSSHIHDGIMWLLIVQAPVSKLQLSQLLLSMSNGSHVQYPWLKFVPVTAFRLEPQETTGPRAHLTVDGENIASQALQVEVLNGAGSVFMR